jgi:hypothetical protein
MYFVTEGGGNEFIYLMFGCKEKLRREKKVREYEKREIDKK